MGSAADRSETGDCRAGGRGFGAAVGQSGRADGGGRRLVQGRHAVAGGVAGHRRRSADARRRPEDPQWRPRARLPRRLVLDGLAGHQRQPRRSAAHHRVPLLHLPLRRPARAYDRHAAEHAGAGLGHWAGAERGWEAGRGAAEQGGGGENPSSETRRVGLAGRRAGHRRLAADQHLGLADLHAAGRRGHRLLHAPDRGAEPARPGQGGVPGRRSVRPVGAGLPALHGQLRRGLLVGVALVGVVYPRVELPARPRPVPALRRHPSGAGAAGVDSDVDRRGQATPGAAGPAAAAGGGAVRRSVRGPAHSRLLDRAGGLAAAGGQRAAGAAAGAAGGAARGAGADGRGVGVDADRRNHRP